MNSKKGYCVLIISYGRPDKCLTAQYLEGINFDRPWYVVCSTDDPQLDGYKRRYGDRVVVFDKDDIDFDPMDNFGIKKVGVYARAACFNVASMLGYKHFASFDDDYTGFNWRYVTKDLKKLATRKCQHVAEMFDAMFSFIDSSPHLLEASFCVNGNYIGGAKTPTVWMDVLPRAVNTFFNSTEKSIYYRGTFEDDTNTFVENCALGRLCLLTPLAGVVIHGMGKKGSTNQGMDAKRRELGVFESQFYAVMLSPSAVSISTKDGEFFSVCSKKEFYEVKILHEKWKKK